MKFALVVFASLALGGCSQQDPHQSPTVPSALVPTVSPSPTPPPGPTASSATSVWGMVVDETGVCIVGATVEVVAGPGIGRRITQATPCDAWAYDGGVVFMELTPNVDVTLRASAPGYRPQERTVIPSPGSPTAILFVPSRLE